MTSSRSSWARRACSCSPAPATSGRSQRLREHDRVRRARRRRSSPARPPGSSSRSTPPTTRPMLTSVLESGAPLGVVTRRPRDGSRPGSAWRCARFRCRPGILSRRCTTRPSATSRRASAGSPSCGPRARRRPRSQHAVQQALRYRLRLERGNAYLGARRPTTSRCARSRSATPASSASSARPMPSSGSRSGSARRSRGRSSPPTRAPT